LTDATAPSPERRRLALEARLGALALALGCLALLIVAARLDPDASGMGTHRQLGLPPCAWLLAYDTPCPTCGMTTAFANAAHGSALGALRAQPAGAILALATAAMFWVALHSAVTGSTLLRVLWRISQRRIGAIVAALLVAGWAYTVVHHLRHGGG